MYMYTGTIPCTGEYKCLLCGHVLEGGHWSLDFKPGKGYEECPRLDKRENKPT